MWYCKSVHYYLIKWVKIGKTNYNNNEDVDFKNIWLDMTQSEIKCSFGLALVDQLWEHTQISSLKFFSVLYAYCGIFFCKYDILKYVWFMF